jgi:hypothetical protein
MIVRNVWARARNADGAVHERTPDLTPEKEEHFYEPQN